MLVQVATGDEWCEDGKALVARAREHGVDARLELYPVATHVFQVFWSFLPEATEAIESAGRFAGEVRGSARRRCAIARTRQRAARSRDTPPVGGSARAARRGAAAARARRARGRQPPEGRNGSATTRCRAARRRPRSRRRPRPPAPAVAAGGWSRAARARSGPRRRSGRGLADRERLHGFLRSQHFQAFWPAEDPLTSGIRSRFGAVRPYLRTPARAPRPPHAATRMPARRGKRAGTAVRSGGRPAASRRAPRRRAAPPEATSGGHVRGGADCSAGRSR